MLFPLLAKRGVHRIKSSVAGNIPRIPQKQPGEELVMKKPEQRGKMSSSTPRKRQGEIKFCN